MLYQLSYTPSAAEQTAQRRKVAFGSKRTALMPEAHGRRKARGPGEIPESRFRFAGGGSRLGARGRQP